MEDRSRKKRRDETRGSQPRTPGGVCAPRTSCMSCSQRTPPSRPSETVLGLAAILDRVHGHESMPAARHRPFPVRQARRPPSTGQVGWMDPEVCDVSRATASALLVGRIVPRPSLHLCCLCGRLANPAPVCGHTSEWSQASNFK